MRSVVPASTVYDYSAFGGCFRSELEFPDLSTASFGRPDRTLRVASGRLRRAGEELVGKHAFGPLNVQLYRGPAGLRLEYADFGSFAIAPGGAEIVWEPGTDSRLEMVRAVVLGPAMALALHEAGTLCLHGSGVVINDRAIALLGPKYHGKSTLALALVAAGARLLTDDALAVDVHPTPTVRPGVHSVRVWPDAAERLGVEELPGRVLAGVKSTVVGLPRHMLGCEPAELASVYMLEPVRPGAMPFPVVRTALQPVAATIALSCHTKLADPLIGYAAAGAQLRWAADIARTVPVYSLSIARNFDDMPEVVATILGWHQDETALAAHAAGAGA